MTIDSPFPEFQLSDVDGFWTVRVGTSLDSVLIGKSRNQATALYVASKTLHRMAIDCQTATANLINDKDAA